MFIPSMLKSAPQEVSVTGLTGGSTSSTTAISQVDLTAAVIINYGTRSGNSGGGFVYGPDWAYWDFSDSTHARANVLVSNGFGNITVKGLVIEFIRGFLLQNVYWNTIDMSSVTSNTLNTGLTLGSKAFIVPAGFTGDYTTLSSVDDSVMQPILSLNRGTGVVSVVRDNTASDNLRTAFFIVDPK